MDPFERGRRAAGTVGGVVRSPIDDELERLRRLIDSVGVAAWDWNLRTGEVWRNSGLTSIFGYPTTELRADIESWSDHVHPDDRQAVVASLHRAIDGGALLWTRTYRFLRYDGSVARVSDRNEILRDGDGDAIRVVGGIRDISDRWAAEEGLRASEARFRDLAEHSSEGIFVEEFVPRTRFTYVNPAMAAMVGTTPQELYADPSLGLRGISEDDRARLWSALDTDGTVTEPVDVDLHRPDGEIRRIRVRGTPTRNAQGRLLRMQAAATDVTREHREREALRVALERERELNDLKTNFVQAVSHELRTPLTSIRGFVELLLSRDLPSHEQTAYLERIAAGAARLHRIVRDVLDLDRLARPETVIDATPVDLAEVVQGVVDETRAGQSAGHPLYSDLRSATALADPALLERVVDNLIRNAMKHTPDGTPVWIRTHAPATIVVEDAGPGIPVELREKLFEPFQQGPQQHQHPSPGTGIGLSLSRRIVRLHRGSIRIGERPEGGARLIVTLPAPTTDTT